MKKKSTGREQAQGFNFFKKAGPSSSSWENQVRSLWREYLVETLGRPEENARERIEQEISASIYHELLSGLETAGWKFEGSVAIDIGCGTGGLVGELVKRSAHAVGIEPGTAWREAPSQRLLSLG